MRSYAIYRVAAEVAEDGVFDPCRSSNIVERFNAEGDAEALRRLEEFRSSAAAGDGATYYYKEINGVWTTDAEGKSGKYYESAYDMMEDMTRCRGLWDRITTEIGYMWSRLGDAWYWLKYMWYFARTGHDYKASWSLDSHLLDEIVWNLKKLKEEHHGCSPLFLDRARAKLHEGEDGFDKDAYAEKMNYDYTDEEWRLAEKMRAEEYDREVENIALYDYYAGCGIANEKLLGGKAEAKAFEAKWRHTLPIKPGTYREFDYKRLAELQQERWDMAWDWIKEYGQCLWD